MNWKSKMEEFGPSSVLFLSTDGASVNFIVVDDPILLSGKYKTKVQERIGCPVVTEDGFVLFIVGKRAARKLTSLEHTFKDHVINVTRHGIEGDTDTSYEVVALDDAALYKKLKSVAATTYNKDALKEAISDANELMNR